MATIYHITTPQAWERALAIGRYEHESLANEGFIHCSTSAQVVPVADRYFKGQRGLILLVINEAKVIREIKYEPAGEASRYPHVYGPLNLDAVIATLPFEPMPDGGFIFPERRNT